MTDIQLCNFLREYYTLSAPSTPITATIVGINANTVQLDTSLGDADVWVGSVVEVTTPDSPAYRARNIIMGNNDDLFYTATQFNKAKLPRVGDTVLVHGGPLAESRIYAFEPDSVESAIKAGIKFFTVINCTGGEVEQVTLGTREKAIYSSQSSYDIEIAVETMDLTGDDTSDDVARVAYDLPTFKEQVLCITHWFRNQASNNATGKGKISFGYASYQRTGSPTRLRGCIMEFTMALR